MSAHGKSSLDDKLAHYILCMVFVHYEVKIFHPVTMLKMTFNLATIPQKTFSPMTFHLMTFPSMPFSSMVLDKLNNDISVSERSSSSQI